MPQWYYDWQLSWLDWWRDHPVAWWSAVAVILVLYVVSTHFQRKHRRH